MKVSFTVFLPETPLYQVTQKNVYLFKGFYHQNWGSQNPFKPIFLDSQYDFKSNLTKIIEYTVDNNLLAVIAQILAQLRHYV